MSGVSLRIAGGIATAVLALAVSVFAPTASAQAKSRNGDVFMYQGADRDKRILEAARKEGTVVVYTSLNLKDSVPITEMFEKKYGVKVSLWRASSEKVVQRGVTEARAGRFSPDVFETNGPEMEALYREQLLDTFYSPHFKDLPPEAFPKHRHYVPDRFNFFTIGWNTNLVKPDEVPNSYQDLLDRKWVGRIGLEASDVDWFAAMVKRMGDQKGLDFFRRLAAQKPELRTGHTLMAELVASGEIPLAISIYNHNIERLAVKNAPVKWKALDPTFGRPQGIAVAKHAPHPHAALLFVDFMLSREGQEIIRERGRVPSSAAVDSPLNKFKYEMIDPVIVLDEDQKWEKLWSQLFLQGRKVQKEQE